MSEFTMEDIYGVDIDEYLLIIGETREGLISKTKHQIDLLLYNKEILRQEFMKIKEDWSEARVYHLLLDIDKKIVAKRANLKRYKKELGYE